MATNSNLTQVLEYLIKNNEAEAKKLLHDVFIEKARAIHEELMGMDEENNEFGSGDQGKDLKNEITAMEDEIDFEETMGEDGEEFEGDDDLGDEMAPDVGDDMEVDDHMDMGDEHIDSPEKAVSIAQDAMHDLDDALEALKAEFAKSNGDEMAPDVDDDIGDVGGNEMHDDDMPADEEVDETNEWELDEDFDDLLENLDLDVVSPNSQKPVAAGEVGSGKSGMTDGNSAKSPVPPSQKERMGASPVVMKGKDVNGFNLETAPSSKKLPILPTDNRRKKFDTDMMKVSKDGDSSALLNKAIPTSGKDSPLSDGGRNLKSL
jgi:hypothetical protein